MNRNYPNSLQLICGMIIFSQFAIVALAFISLNSDPGKSSIESGGALSFVVPIFFVGCLFASGTLFRTIIRKANTAEEISTKLTHYRTATIIRYALLEGPSILAVVAYFLTKDLMYLIIPGAVILFLLILFPTRIRIMKDLSIGREELDAEL